MNREQRQEVLRDARAELVETREKLAALNRRALQLDQVVRGLSGLLEEDDETVEAEFILDPADVEAAMMISARNAAVERMHPDRRLMRPRDAVLQVLTMRPDTPLAPKEVVELVRKIGLFNPRLKSGSNGYTTALNRLAEEPGTGVDRDEEGRYIFRPERQALSATLTGGGSLFAGEIVSE